MTMFCRYDQRDQRKLYCLTHHESHPEHAYDGLVISDLHGQSPSKQERDALFDEYFSLGNPRWDSPEGRRQSQVFEAIMHSLPLPTVADVELIPEESTYDASA